MEGVYTPPYRTASPFQPPPLYPVTLKGYRSETASSAQLLSRALAEEIRLLVPPRLQLCEEWNLVYSLDQDGVSLGTLYKKCDDLRGLRNGFILVVKDGEDGVSHSPSHVQEFILTKHSSSAPTSQKHHTPLPTISAQANVSSGAPASSPPLYPTYKIFLLPPRPTPPISNEAPQSEPPKT